jgi:hypothetical protein
MRRRDLLALAGSTLLHAQQQKRVALVITTYYRNSHADVIGTRLLEGYDYNGQFQKPRVDVVAMYTDQVHAKDLSRGLAQKHNVPIRATVAEAVTGADGVVLIGEHGDYPDNEKGQKLYPRHRLFSDIVAAFRKQNRVVPVFSDKHLSVDWDKAKWMYDQSRELKFPFMAGSSLPVSWRKPPLEIPLGANVTQAVVAFYGGKEAYGFHALESLQCMVERRGGGETGIRSVQAIEGDAVWQWTTQNSWASRLLDAALQRSETLNGANPRQVVKTPILFLLDYRDGLKSAVYLLNGALTDCVFAADVNGKPRPESTEIWLQGGRPYAHFSNLTHYIEELILQGREQYPVERTLLTTGALASLMDSSFQKGARIETPHLAVRYRAPKESLYNRGPVPALEGA